VRSELDDRLARGVVELAQWWTQASQEARFEALKKAIHGEGPPLQTLRLAIIVAEVEAGEVGEG